MSIASYVIHNEIQLLKTTMSKNECFKAFYDRKSAHDSDDVTKRFLCHNLPSLVIGEMESVLKPTFDSGSRKMYFGV